MDSEIRTHLNTLMAELVDGDRSVLNEVYSLLWPVIAAFCRKTLGYADAQDAAQQALLKLFDQAATFDRRRDVVTWALAVAAWEVRTVRKRHERSKLALYDDAHAADDAKDPEWEIAERELIEAACSVLGQLSGNDQETLISTFSEEAPEGVAGATFRKRRERALVRLRTAWRRIYASE